MSVTAHIGQVFISSNGMQVHGKDGLDLYINIELMVFTKETPEKQAIEEIKQNNEDFHNWIWKSCACSAYGAFISIAMAQGFVEAVKQAGVMLVLTMLIQVGQKTFASTRPSAPLWCRNSWAAILLGTDDLDR